MADKPKKDNNEKTAGNNQWTETHLKASPTNVNVTTVPAATEKYPRISGDII